jgi:hypothetical protein
LQEWVDVNDKVFANTVTHMSKENTTFANHLKHVQIQWYTANNKICAHLQQIYCLPGYIGLIPSCSYPSADMQADYSKDLDRTASADGNDWEDKDAKDECLCVCYDFP